MMHARTAPTPECPPVRHPLAQSWGLVRPQLATLPLSRATAEGDPRVLVDGRASRRRGACLQP